ncbi:CHAT domain protein [Ceratobasidium sp. AG-Ba]|nr:CHAT domain protein [Ceratobasidium sp. AG-Ba]
MAIEYHKRALSLVPQEHTLMPHVLASAGRSYLAESARSRDLENVNNAIQLLDRASSLMSDDNASNLGVLYLYPGLSMLFKQKISNHEGTPNPSDIMNYLNHGLQYAVGELAPISLLLDVGSAYIIRSAEHDVDTAIGHYNRALLLTPDGHPQRSLLLSYLGNSYLSRFRYQRDPADIEKSFNYHVLALLLTPGIDCADPKFLETLETYIDFTLKHLEDHKIVDNAITSLSQIISLLSDEHFVKPTILNNLGILYSRKSEYFGTVEDVEKAINYSGRAVALSRLDHKDRCRWLGNLGNSYYYRFNHLRCIADLNQAIEWQTQATLSTSPDNAAMPMLLNNLGTSYLSKFEYYNELTDLDHAIEIQGQAVALASDEAQRSTCLSNLGNSYQRRFERLGSLEDVDKSIQYKTEAISLTPGEFRGFYKLFNNISSSYEQRFEKFGELADLHKAIDYQERAIKLTPRGHADRPSVLSNLANSYLHRFKRLGELQDIDSSIECHVEAVSLVPEGSAVLHRYYNDLGASYHNRFDRLGELRDLDKAIEYQAQAVSLTLDESSKKPVLLSNLGGSYQGRFERLGNLGDIDSAISCQTQALLLTPNDDPLRSMRLNNIAYAYAGRFRLTKEVADVNEAIEHFNQAISLLDDAHTIKPQILESLGFSYCARFEYLGQLDDVEKAIKYQTEALSLMPQQHERMSNLLSSLGSSHRALFERINNPKDLELSLKYFRAAALSEIGHPSVRFISAHNWGALSLLNESPSTLEAHSLMMILMPQVVWLGLSMGQRYEVISAYVQRAATNAVLAAIYLHRYDLAVEYFEQGRSIVWNQILRLRMPLESVSASDPQLAERLERIARSLQLKDAQVLDESNQMPGLPPLEYSDPQYCRLAEEWGRLVEEARALPGCHGFLNPRQIVELMKAARSGAVAMINIHKNSCDVLGLLPKSESVVHIPLPEFSYDKAVTMRASFLDALRQGNIRNRSARRPVFSKLASHNAIEAILADLWNDLRSSPNERLRRVTWCTAGPLAFLPLHGAGLYEGFGSRVFDHVVSSYSPTLNALLNAIPSPTDFRLLAVGQLETRGCPVLPGTVVELDRVQEKVGDLGFMRLEGERATAESVLAAMGHHSWVHLACHASHHSSKPIKSAFRLYDKNLDLAAISSATVESRGLAFLSACETAMGNSQLPDEAVHLAAGMLIAGYPSVIATMWSIEDDDAPLVAEKVYAHVLKGSLPKLEETAEALHFAVADLRDSIGEKGYLRWLPYVHFGL